MFRENRYQGALSPEAARTTTRKVSLALHPGNRPLARAAGEWAYAEAAVQRGGSDTAEYAAANRKIAKIGLGEELTSEAIALGVNVTDYLMGSRQGLGAISDDEKKVVVGVLEAQKSSQEMKDWNKNRDRKRFQLEESFEDLMDLTSTELKIHNSNRRNDLFKDPSYQAATQVGKERIETRTMTEEEYYELAPSGPDNPQKLTSLR